MTTTQTDPTSATAPHAAPEIVGPYSPWPKVRGMMRDGGHLTPGALLAAPVFAHRIALHP